MKKAKRPKPNTWSMQRLAHERETQDATLAAYQLPAFRKDADSPATTAQLLCTSSATPMTLDQYRRVFRTGRLMGNIFLALFGISYLLLFGWVLSYAWDQAAILTNVMLYAIGFLVVIWQISRHRARYHVGRYESARCKGDVADAVLEIYQDRAVKTSERGQTVIWFFEADGLYEWRDMLCLRKGNHVIAWRAADLTEAQVGLIRKLIYARIDRTRRVFFSRLQSRRDMVRPLSDIEPPTEQVQMIYQPPAANKWTRARRRVSENAVLTGCATLSVVLVIASVFEITGIHLIDIVLFFALFYAATLALLWMLTVLTDTEDERDIPALLSVTDTGIAVTRRDKTVFFLKRDIEWRYTATGVWILIPQDTFWIRFSDISDGQMLQAMLPRPTRI